MNGALLSLKLVYERACNSQEIPTVIKMKIAARGNEHDAEVWQFRNGEHLVMIPTFAPLFMSNRMAMPADVDRWIMTEEEFAAWGARCETS